MGSTDAATASGGLVVAGKINKVHGIKGEVKVQPYFGFPSDFLSYGELSLRLPGEERQIFQVERCRPQSADVILKLEGLDDRNQAECFRGAEVLVARELLPELPPGEYYWHELEGLLVETDTGKSLGKAATYLKTAGHDVMVVRGGGREYLIPMTKEFILERDVARGVLIVQDLPGLFEMND